MELVLILAGAVAVWFMFLRPRVRAREQSQEFQAELRCPTVDESSLEGTFEHEAFIDFERMSLVDVTSDFDYQHTRVYRLRRMDGPVWECCEETESRRRSAAHREAERGAGWVSPEHERRYRLIDDPSAWEPLAPEFLEAAYQRFLHQYDPSSASVGQPGRLERAVARDFVKGTPRPKAVLGA
jgi:hypothetical protein